MARDQQRPGCHDQSHERQADDAKAGGGELNRGERAGPQHDDTEAGREDLE